jgi:hypothetical protein
MMGDRDRDRERDRGDRGERDYRGGDRDEPRTTLYLCQYFS